MNEFTGMAQTTIWSPPEIEMPISEIRCWSPDKLPGIFLESLDAIDQLSKRKARNDEWVELTVKSQFQDQHPPIQK
jgi:hypothetical protein